MKKPLVLTLLCLLCVLAAGCVSLPTGGGVRSGPALGEETTDTAPAFSPPGPSEGDSPADIASGFLDAMQANPLTTAVARDFLTNAASAAWDPEAATIIYGARTFDVAGSTVTVTLSDVARLDRRGAWLGRADGPLQQEFRLAKENGEWRLTDPPSALVVPDTYFESRFDPYSLYFFDKSAEVLVPEPVYLPRGEQTPTLLVGGLLKGPGQKLLGVTRSFVPASTEVDLSVPVSEGGVVEVPLSDEVLDLDDGDLQMLSAQLAWTLRQVSGVRSLRITVDGSPLAVPGLGTEQSVTAWGEFDPRVNWASEELFGLREGRVVTLVGGVERRVAGVFGSNALGVRTIAVDLPAQRIAGVTSDGAAVLLAPRAGAPGEPPESADVVFSGAADLLRPAWDLYGQLWLVDRTGSGAVVYNLRSGVARQVAAPGITGAQVKDFEISRDGTRLAAVLEREGSDSVVISRVGRSNEGQVRNLLPAQEMPVGDLEVTEIRDIAWRTPEDLAVLAGPESGRSQVIVAQIDGSVALGNVASNPEVFRDEASRVVTSPALGVSLYVGTARGQLFELAADGRWTGTSFKRGLSSPGFVG